LDNDGIIPRSARSRAGRWSTLSIAGVPTLMPDVGFSDAAIGGLIVGARDANGNRLTDFALIGKAFNPDGSMRDFAYGTVVGSVMSGGEGPSNDDFSPLSAPQKRYSTLASTKFDLNERTQVSADLRHSRMYNHYIWFGDHNRGNAATGEIVIALENAFLPDAVRAGMQSAGANTLVMGRFNNDINYPHIDFERKTTQASLAIDGGFGVNWRWSTYYAYGQAAQNFDTPGFILAQEWTNALDAVIHPVTGLPVCRIALTDTNSHCVPINLFGEGAPSPAAVDYVTDTPSERSTIKLHTFGASLRGEPFELPAGPVSIATGVEARRESIEQRVGALDAAKAFRAFSFNPMQGHFTVKELFGEILLPIANGHPGFQDFSINAAARVSDYSTTGAIWSWKVGATNAFFTGFRGRIALSRDIRSANLNELYTTSTTGWSNVLDPMTNQTVYALSNGGGNPNLVPETANTLTAGIVWSPQSIPGLDLSVDYFNIEIKDVITTVGIQDTLNRCAAGSPAMCARVERDANGEIIRIVSTYTNLSQYKTDGIDVEIAWRGPVNLFGISGRFTARTLGTFVHSLTTDDGVRKLEYVTSQGYAFALGVPKWRAISSLAFDSARFSANARARYISAGQYDRNQNIINGAIGSYVYYDIGGSAKFRDGGVELYATIHNLTNKQAPIASTFSPTYDILGRYTSVGVRVNF